MGLFVPTTARRAPFMFATHVFVRVALVEWVHVLSTSKAFVGFESGPLPLQEPILLLCSATTGYDFCLEMKKKTSIHERKRGEARQDSFLFHPLIGPHLAIRSDSLRNLKIQENWKGGESSDLCSRLLQMTYELYTFVP